MIDDKAKQFFDDFEGVNENLYSPFLIDVKNKTSGELHQCVTYLLDNFRPEILNEKTILFESYTSKNEFLPEYQKKDDVPDNWTRYSTVKDFKNI